MRNAIIYVSYSRPRFSDSCTDLKRNIDTAARSYVHFFADMGRGLGANVKAYAPRSSRLQYFVFARRARVLCTVFTISNVLIEIIKTFQIAGPSSLDFAAIVSKLNQKSSFRVVEYCL